MARNIEIKARLPQGIDEVEARARRLADHGPELLLQDDTFFLVPRGRLKLREFADGSAELIAYHRPDTEGPKLSDFIRTPVPDPAALRRSLALTCGLRGRVRKQRTLYLVGQTRVHLDRVEGLGDHLELEVVLRDDQGAEHGEAVARDLIAQLGIAADQLIAGAYIDLLEARNAKDPTP